MTKLPEALMRDIAAKQYHDRSKEDRQWVPSYTEAFTQGAAWMYERAKVLEEALERIADKHGDWSEAFMRFNAREALKQWRVKND